MGFLRTCDNKNNCRVCSIISRKVKLTELLVKYRNASITNIFYRPICTALIGWVCDAVAHSSNMDGGQIKWIICHPTKKYSKFET